MSTIVSIVLAVLRLADLVLNYARERQMMKAGEDAEIAKASASILLKTGVAKEVMQQLAPLNDDQVDKMLKELEP